MKTWWTEKGWPWLKGNWWVLLILPLMLLVAIGMVVMNVFGRRTVVVDPTANADRRAKEEDERRTAELQAERDRLADELEEVRASRDKLRAQFETQLAAEVEALRNDPDTLRERMLEVGRR